jgi:hypothetical protein
MVRHVVADRFELLSQAGKGGMGSVHRARDRQTGNEVAVKILNLDRPMDVARFGREASLLAQVQHPNIVGYVDHGMTTDGIYYLAQEWVDGITLRTQLRTLGVTLAEGVVMALGLADALGAAHDLNVVHRDVKPENLILAGGEAERLKLVDFGIARVADDAAKLTRTGTMIGTVSYMAPEQARGRGNIGPAADVWAVGCVLYEIMTGRAPFPGHTPMAIRAKVLLDHPIPVAELCPEAPPSLTKLIDRMLLKAPEQRPQTGAEAASLLRQLGAMPAGPRRRSGATEPATAAMPVRSRSREQVAPGGPGEIKAFVFFTSCEVAQPDTVTDHQATLERAADKHGLDVHIMEDGSALLAARAGGKAGAVGAARAALELREILPDVAVSIVGQHGDDAMGEALERGSQALERAAMGALFGDIVAGAEAGVHVDDIIADLVAEEGDVSPGADGPILRPRRHGSGS